MSIFCNDIISVLVVVSNRDKLYIWDCLKSIKISLKNSRVKAEYIVILNGVQVDLSKSGIPTLTKIYNKRNLGFARGVNQAIKIAIGNWCIIACPDTITSASSIPRLLKRRRKKIAIISPQVISPDKSLQYTIVPIPSLWNMFIEQSYIYRIFPSLFKFSLSYTYRYRVKHYISEASAAIWWLVNRNAFINIGGFDENFFLYFEDVDLCKRLHDKNYKILYIPNATVVHSSHQGTGGNTDGSLYFNSIQTYLNKYYDTLYTTFCLSIFIFGCLFRLVFWNLVILIEKNAFITKKANEKLIFCKSVLYAACRIKY